MKELLKELVKEYKTNKEFKYSIIIGIFVLILVLGLEYLV